MAEAIITQVIFGEQGLEITYFERRDQSDTVGIMKTMMMAITEQISDLVQTAQDDLTDLLDAGLLQLRNPPQKISPRDRIRGYQPDTDEE